MSRYVSFNVKMPVEEANAFKQALEDSEFEHDHLQRYRTNGKYAEFVRFLVRRRMMDSGEDEE